VTRGQSVDGSGLWPSKTKARLPLYFPNGIPKTPFLINTRPRHYLPSMKLAGWKLQNIKPVRRGLCVDPSDNFNSVVPVTDLIKRLGVHYLSDRARQPLSAEITRLVRQQRQHDTLQTAHIINLSYRPHYVSCTSVRPSIRPSVNLIKAPNSITEKAASWVTQN